MQTTRSSSQGCGGKRNHKVIKTSNGPRTAFFRLKAMQWSANSTRTAASPRRCAWQRIRNFGQVGRGYDGGLAVQHSADGKGVMPPDKGSQIGCGVGAAAAWARSRGPDLRQLRHAALRPLIPTFRQPRRLAPRRRTKHPTCTPRSIATGSMQSQPGRCRARRRRNT
jgi:hypothetical protein